MTDPFWSATPDVANTNPPPETASLPGGAVPPGAGPAPRAGRPPFRSLAVAGLTVAMGAAGFAVGRAATNPGSPPALSAAVTVPSPRTVPPSTASTIPGASTGAAVAAVTPAVVDIDTSVDFGAGLASGTGMVLTPDGEVLTNNHVVEGATTITATVPSTHRTYKASVVGTDPTDDVALIQLQDASGLVTIPIGDSSQVAVGDRVIAIGNAGGVGGTPAVATGFVQGIAQTITASDGTSRSETLTGMIQTDAALQPGDSGGPLANASAQVIGMDTAALDGGRFNTADNAGFAIPIAKAMSIVRQIRIGQATATIHLGLPAFLGVGTNHGGTAGATVAHVVAGSPAANAGIAAGDTITTLGGKAVDSPDTLATLIKQRRPGDHVAVGWTSATGRARQATVTLAAGPAD